MFEHYFHLILGYLSFFGAANVQILCHFNAHIGRTLRKMTL